MPFAPCFLNSDFPPGRRRRPLWAGGRIPTSHFQIPLPVLFSAYAPRTKPFALCATPFAPCFSNSDFPPGRRRRPLWAGGHIPTSEFNNSDIRLQKFPLPHSDFRIQLFPLPHSLFYSLLMCYAPCTRPFALCAMPSALCFFTSHFRIQTSDF
jgi:hypothetical protein